MMRNSQNSTHEEPSPTLDGDSSSEDSEPSPRKYYYDDSTGYEIYREDESADEDQPLDLEDE